LGPHHGLECLLRFTIHNEIIGQFFHEKINQINESEKLLQTIKKRGEAANSDHYWFTIKNVPSFFIYTMGSNKNYHDVFDKFDNLTFSAFENMGKLMIDFVRKLDK
jgi:hypothetical protein